MVRISAETTNVCAVQFHYNGDKAKGPTVEIMGRGSSKEGRHLVQSKHLSLEKIFILHVRCERGQERRNVKQPCQLGNQTVVAT